MWTRSPYSDRCCGDTMLFWQSYTENFRASFQRYDDGDGDSYSR